uniref:DUF4378 domain-containing protein n=1 Tax=Tanacetum cinerariifolium TaxID=118510 RepID=A0A6L2MJ41_TANCI|nr:hypothetical protein [Tanacetum cinerariifolium]
MTRRQKRWKLYPTSRTMSQRTSILLEEKTLLLTKKTESEPIIWDIGNEEEEYPFVNKYLSFKEEPIMFVEDESCPVYDTDNEKDVKHAPKYDFDGDELVYEDEEVCLPDVGESLVIRGVGITFSVPSVLLRINTYRMTWLTRVQEACTFYDTDVPDGSSPVDQRAIDENEAGLWIKLQILKSESEENGLESETVTLSDENATGKSFYIGQNNKPIRFFGPKESQQFLYLVDVLNELGFHGNKMEEELWNMLVGQENEVNADLSEKSIGKEPWLELGDEVDSIVEEIEAFLFNEFVTELVAI